MSDGERLTDEQLGQIVGAIQAANKQHICRFDECEAKVIHMLADMMDRQGQENLRQLLDFGATLRRLKSAGQVAFIIAIIGGLLSVIWLGVLAKVRGE